MLSSQNTALEPTYVSDKRKFFNGRRFATCVKTEQVSGAEKWLGYLLGPAVAAAFRAFGDGYREVLR